MEVLVGSSSRSHLESFRDVDGGLMNNMNLKRCVILLTALGDRCILPRSKRLFLANWTAPEHVLARHMIATRALLQ